MATDKQIEANRRNAQKSTGPRSVEGKAVSRFNALKTGITAKSMVIPGEDPDELDSLAVEYHRQFQPATALARCLVDALVYADWQLRRLRRVEAQVWCNEIKEAKATTFGINSESPLGDVFARSRNTFHFLQRRLDAAERSYYRALKQLQRDQPDDRDPGPDPDLAPDPEPPSPELASFSTIPCASTPQPPDLPPTGNLQSQPVRARAANAASLPHDVVF